MYRFLCYASRNSVPRTNFVTFVRKTHTTTKLPANYRLLDNAITSFNFRRVDELLEQRAYTHNHFEWAAQTATKEASFVKFEYKFATLLSLILPVLFGPTFVVVPVGFTARGIYLHTCLRRVIRICDDKFDQTH